MECIVCGAPNAERHHIFFGTANRRKSEQYGYVIPLCAEHHRGNKGIHFDREFDLKVKRIAQKDFEKRFGSRDDFRREFGKSYL